jgi:hypothetical protein
MTKKLIPKVAMYSEPLYISCDECEFENQKMDIFQNEN